jgi:hypothetical protein
MVSTTFELTLAPPVLLVKELLLQELLELLLLLVVLLPRASVMKRELPAHTAAAHSSELKATPHSMVSMTSELTLVALVLQELLVLLLLPRASVE